METCQRAWTQVGVMTCVAVLGLATAYVDLRLDTV